MTLNTVVLSMDTSRLAVFITLALLNLLTGQHFFGLSRKQELTYRNYLACHGSVLGSSNEGIRTIFEVRLIPIS